MPRNNAATNCYRHRRDVRDNGSSVVDHTIELSWLRRLSSGYTPRNDREVSRGRNPRCVEAAYSDGSMISMRVCAAVELHFRHRLVAERRANPSPAALSLSSAFRHFFLSRPRVDTHGSAICWPTSSSIARLDGRCFETLGSTLDSLRVSQLNAGGDVSVPRAGARCAIEPGSRPTADSRLSPDCDNNQRRLTKGI
jgi:hypothetical protein